jgi:hypothetical protein
MNEWEQVDRHAMVIHAPWTRKMGWSDKDDE